MQGKLIKIKSIHQNMRTDVMEGSFSKLPKLGQPFVIIGASLTPGKNARMISTTEVLQIQKEEGRLFFKTANSEYELVRYPEVVEEKKDESPPA